ncbi:MAG: SUMF1/EgtB/PvdO family nonheme iron enzyme [Planctomycetota bacterium]|nr:SUMF1/EgtB/PvdO family nonheme iron enzyme [Planctomycetota bacterium]
MSKSFDNNPLPPTMPGGGTGINHGGTGITPGGRGLRSHLMVNKSLSVPIQDLTEDKLLSFAPRAEVDGRSVPRLGKIPLLARLGTGGMSAVYYGIHPNLKVEVAVKVLPLSMAEKDPVLIERFFREAQTAAAVRSPHLVHVSDVDEDNGLFYIVMEYVTGISAAQLIKDAVASGKPGVTENDALDICIAAAKGLAAAHAEGIVHRDVKPANIMLPNRKDGKPGHDYNQAKLADLGLARQESSAGLTTSFQVMGTPGYMAPEQVQDAKSAGKPADVWGMGATLYALLAGRAPFTGRTSMEVLMYTVEQPHAPITRIRNDISLETEAVVDRCLAKDAAKRFQSADDLLESLKAARPNRIPTVRKLDSERLRAAVSKTVIIPKKPAAKSSARLSVATPPPSSKEIKPPEMKEASSKSRSGRASQSSSALPTTMVSQAGSLEADWKHRVYEDWPVAAGDMPRRMQETAEATGLPEKKSIALPGNVSLEFALLPAAKFVMGSPHDEDGRDKDELTHYVRLTKPFYMGIYPVTQAQYEAVTGTNPSRFKGETDSPRRPVERVSWKEIREKFLPAIQPFAPQGWFYRLPTEAEWEYACRAGSAEAYFFGPKLNSRQALFKWDSSHRTGDTYIMKKPSTSRLSSLRPGEAWPETLEVGVFPPNAFGLYDMHGNVWEWCEDYYHPDFYHREPALDPVNTEESNLHVLRGGSWNYSDKYCRSAKRYQSQRDARFFNIGFRLVLVPKKDT